MTFKRKLAEQESAGIPQVLTENPLKLVALYEKPEAPGRCMRAACMSEKRQDSRGVGS